jgi:RNA-directed DNA polymerase
MAPFEEIETPSKVQKLQRTLYRKAKEDRKWRAWSLYADLCRLDVLETALKAVLNNAGAAGVDGMTTEAVKADQPAFLTELQTQLRSKSYRPSPVRRVWIPKADGKQRPLGIPTVKDRVVQMALSLLLTPIFEADFNEGSFGYRPGRNAHQALEAIVAALLQGKHEVIDADLSGYFDTIPHAALLREVARRVSDGSILRLVKLFLKAPIVEESEGKRRIEPNTKGTPQGGVISPLLANLYLNSLDHGVNGKPELEARLVRYADDFVILCRPGKSGAIYERLKVYLQRKGLKLNEAKTRCVKMHQESFRFLGFEVYWRRSSRTKRFYPHVEPSRRAQQRLRDIVRGELNRWTTERSSVEAVRKVNRIVRGWSHYFHYANCTRTFVAMQNWLQQRYRFWLWRKYGRKHHPYRFFSNDRLHGLYGLWPMPLHAPWNR